MTNGTVVLLFSTFSQAQYEQSVCAVRYIFITWAPNRTMTFDHDKAMTLSRPDRSAIGSMDEAVKPLCDLINGSDNYFTTSSCAGRIAVMSESGDHNKQKAEWLFVSHHPISITTLKSSLFPLPHHEVWFRQESMILHVMCRTHEDAFTLVGEAREVGLKRSGVISSKNRIVVEVLGTERLELPIAVNGELVVSDEYLELIVDIANKKLKRTREKIKKLKNRLSTFLGP